MLILVYAERMLNLRLVIAWVDYLLFVFLRKVLFHSNKQCNGKHISAFRLSFSWENILVVVTYV